MLGLAFAEAHRYHQKIAEHAEAEKAPGRKRRLRRKKSKPKGKSLIPPIPVAKNPSKSDRHIAKDLYLALRCWWKDDRKKQLHRVLLANWEGDSVLDHMLEEGNFASVRGKVMNKIEGKVLIGHGLDYCLYSLQIQHPWANLRDGASYLPFMRETVDPLTVMFLPRSLSDLMEEILNRKLPDEPSTYSIQQEAKGCMDLYRTVRYEWENEITKLIQQKERQREVKLEPREPVQLSCISEDPDQRCEDFIRGKKGNGRGLAPPLTSRKKYDDSHDHAEDLSTQAPTEVTHESEDASLSVRDDLSVRSKTSSDNIWMPQDAALEDGSRGTNGSWGLWLPRPVHESTHPIDADDWLNEEWLSESRTLKPEELGHYDEESFGHLPSRLLNDSSSDGSDCAVPVREESSLFVEGMDWLEPDIGTRRSTRRETRNGRHRKSHSRNKLSLTSIQEDSLFPRGSGERGRNRSMHSSGDDWLTEERSSNTSRFPFFRKRSTGADDATRSADRVPRLYGVGDTGDDEEGHVDYPRQETESSHPVFAGGLDWDKDETTGTGSPRFSLFRKKTSGTE